MLVKYNLTVEGKPVSVSVDVPDPQAFGDVKYSGDRKAVAVVKEALALYGRGQTFNTVDKRCAAADLNVALADPYFQQFSPKLISGQEMIDKFKMPKLPMGFKW